MITRSERFHTLQVVLLVGAIALFTLIYVLNAWISDDAYITFRTIDNLANGYGAVWNTQERVQAYTHPLWMWLIVALHAVTHEFFYTVITLSYVICLAAVLLLGKVAKRWWSTHLLIVVLCASKAFIDFTSSGLENCLSYLIAAGFFGCLLKYDRPFDTYSLGQIMITTAIASLAFINRQDTVLLYAPVLALLMLVAIRRDRWCGFAYLCIGAMPAIGWTLFTVVYYGALIPNTGYAKLSTGISTTALALQGLRYYAYTARYDLWTLATIATALLLLCFVRRTSLATRTIGRCAALGILLYLVYVVRIGGDFFAGRFFALPFFVSAWLLISLIRSSRIAALVVAAALVAMFINPKAPIKSNLDYEWIPEVAGISDQRGTYLAFTGLLVHIVRGAVVHPWQTSGAKLRLNGTRVAVRRAIGMAGLAAGPKVHIIDLYALADPLLARLPAESRGKIP